MRARRSISDTFVDVWLGPGEDPGRGPVYTDFTEFHHALESYRSVLLLILVGPPLFMMLLVAALIFIGVSPSVIAGGVLLFLPVFMVCLIAAQAWLWDNRRPRHPALYWDK
ncbi:MAG TPA: hypothetical protein VI893_04005 [Thermoplasmata archaeon]|nr:hypothetical protein [Thermoplasmata archaeon]